MNETILLVDDLQASLASKKDFFKQAAVEVLTAKDGLEALEILKKKSAHLVFMNLQMPRMDGATCCKALKADPSLCHIPVVIISLRGSDKEKEDCLAAGCDYFLTRPAERQHFLEIAREFIPDIDRRERRWSCSYQCAIRCQDETATCSLYDLSVEGAFLATDLSGLLFDVVQLCFVLPDGTKIESSSRIVWLNEGDATRPKGFGVKFALMDRDTKAAVTRFLEMEQQQKTITDAA